MSTSFFANHYPIYHLDTYDKVYKLSFILWYIGYLAAYPVAVGKNQLPGIYFHSFFTFLILLMIFENYDSNY